MKYKISLIKDPKKKNEKAEYSIKLKSRVVLIERLSTHISVSSFLVKTLLK